MPVPSAAGMPWEGKHWSDEGTQQWRDSLTDSQVDEWRDWQHAAEEAEKEDYWRAQEQRDETYFDQVEQAVPTDPDAPAPSLESQPPVATGPTVAFTDENGNPLDALVNDQPVHIQVTVPRRAGETPPETIDATVSGTQTTLGIEYAGTETVTLRWTGNATGPAVYRSDLLTIEKGGGGAGSIGAGGLEVSTGSMDGFYTDDGDVIQVGFGTATSAVQVYTSVTRLELALTMVAIGSAREMYTNVLVNLAGLEAELAKATNVADKAEIQAQIDQLQATAQQAVGLAQRATTYVNTVDVLDHQKLAVARLYAGWLGLFRKPTVTATGEEEPPPFGPAFVPDPREESMIVYDASQEAKEEVKRIMWSGLTQATIGGYRLLAQATLVAQIMTLVPGGMTERGKPATFLDKWGAFWDLVTQGALMGAMIKWNHQTTVGHTTARIPRVKPVSDQPTAMRAPSGTPVTPEAAGMLRDAGFDAQMVARQHDVQIQVRFTNPDAMVPRAMGAIPKPMQIKPKTIKPIDREIGAPEGALDASPGLFEPRLPARGNRTDAEWNTLVNRFNERKAEWEGAIGDYTRGLVAKGEFQLRDGMVMGKNGEVIAGDYDLFDITNLDGTPVSPQVYDAVVGDLMVASGFQAAHGAHMRWNPRADDPGYHIDFSTDLDGSLQGLAKWWADRNIFRSIRERHQPGGEALITFTGSQPPVVTYAGEVVGPKLADLGITVPVTGVTTPGIFVRPTLYGATTQQLIDGRLPEGAGWEWTGAFDWTAEQQWWTEQYANIQAGIGLVTPPATPTVTLAPALTKPQGPGFNWKPIAIGGALVGTLLIGGVVLLNQPGAGPGIAVGSPTAAPATQPDVPDPNMPPGTDPPTQPPVIQPPTDAPPTQPDVPDPNMPPEIAWNEPAVAGLFGSMVNGMIEAPSGWALLSDPAGDQFTFGTGFAPPAQLQPWVDLVGVAGFLTTFDADQAQAFSAAFPCAGTVGSIRISCNQQMPMTAGLHAVVLTGWNSAFPDPFPQMANCSWAVQTNADDDLATGFPDPPDGHPLIGSDVYHETLMFFGTDGTLQNYSLASDYGAPPRSDTGTQYGNLPTLARALINTAGPPGAPMTIMFVIPHDDFGPFFGAHGYCIGDTADPGESVAIDAIGDPGDADYPFFQDIR